MTRRKREELTSDELHATLYGLPDTDVWIKTRDKNGKFRAYRATRVEMFQDMGIAIVAELP
jgi:hypothetical protein